MQKVGYLAERVFFTLGERLALVVLFIVAGIVLTTQNSQASFSYQPTPASPVSAEPESVAWVPSTPTPTPIPPTPTNTPTPTPLPTSTPTPPPADPSSNDVWEKIAECESHKNWGINSGNGYYGGLQFSQGAWNSVGGSGMPHEASREEQINRGKMLQDKRGWGVWGECAKRLGLD